MIPLYVLQGKAFVWNADDWSILRKNHRIVGELIGTVASFPRQNSHPGLPMALMYEEVVLLLEEGLCKLFEYDYSRDTSGDSLSELAKNTEIRIFSEQSDSMREKRIEQLSSKIDLIVSGKRKKMSKDENFVCDKDALLQEEIEKLPPLSIEHSLVQISTEHPWPHELKEVTIDELAQTSSSEINTVRCKTFKDLWNRGFYITAGTKFGADFLVYLGDPVKFHAMYMVKCMNSSEEDISLKRVVAFGRLGVSVNKVTVIAYLNKENQVLYQSLQWHDNLF